MFEQLIENPLFLFLILLWIIPWKGVALWRAARNNNKNWFAFILIFNTFAIIEIIYLFFFAKKKDVNKD